MNWRMALLPGLLLAGRPARGGCRDLIQQLDREILALRARNTALEEQVAACVPPASTAKVHLELRQVYADSDVAVGREGPYVVVTIPTASLFPPNSLDLLPGGLRLLDLLATALNLHPDQDVWIIGHADGPPMVGALARMYPSPWEWSMAQALAVLRALHTRYGVPAARFTVAGKGATEPVNPGTTSTAAERNRRIEVIIGHLEP